MRLVYWLIIGVILLFPFGQLEKIPLGIPSVSVYWHDLVISLALGIGILVSYQQLLKMLMLPLISPLLSFIAFGAFSLILNPLHLPLADLLVASGYLIRFIFYAALYPLVYLLLKQRPTKAVFILWLLFFAGVTVAVFGFGQYFLYPNLRHLYYLGWDPHQYRLFSTLFDPNFTGLILVLTLILGLGILWSDGGNKGFRGLVLKFSLLTTFVALILTYSRSSYLVLAISLPILTFRRPSFSRLLIIFYILFAIILLFLPRPFGEGVRLERISTIESRVQSYQLAIAIIKRYPIFGVGFNAYRYGMHRLGFLSQPEWRHIHSAAGTDNSFLFAWATAGVGGLVSLLWFLGRVFILSLKLNGPWVYTRQVVMVSLVALIAHSFFANSLFYPWVLIWIWILLGASG